MVRLSLFTGKLMLVTAALISLSILPNYHSQTIVCAGFAGYEGWESFQYLLDLNNGHLARDNRSLAVQPATSLPPPGAVSPSGRWIVQTGIDQAAPQPAIWLKVVAADTGAVQFTDTNTVFSEFQWSPTGDVLAFRNVDDRGQVRLIVVDMDTGWRAERTVESSSPHSPLIRGWSPDGRYVIVVVTPNYSIRLEFWNPRTDQTALVTSQYSSVGDVSFSPDRTAVAVIGYAPNFTELTIIVPDEKRIVRDVDGVANTVTVLRLQWSPVSTSRFFLLQYADMQGGQHFAVYGIDGKMIDDLTLSQQAGMPSASVENVGWLNNGALRVDFVDPNGLKAIMAVQFPSAQRTIIARNITKLTQHISPDWISVVSRERELVRAEVINLSTNKRIDLFETAGDFGDGVFGERTVLYTWSRGSGEDREVLLTWADLHTGRVTTVGGFTDVRDVVWFTAPYVMFVNREKITHDVYLLNLDTVQRLKMGEGYSEYRFEMYDANGLHTTDQTSATRVGRWWVTSDGRKGFDLIELADTGAVKPYRVSSAVDLTGIDVMEGYKAGKRHVFIAPGARHVAIKLGEPHDELLVLAAADGSWVKTLRSGLRGLGDPLWSSDGSVLAFTQALPGGWTTLEFVTTDGRPIRSLYQPSSTYYGLALTNCASPVNLQP